jgi:WD domain, G-beta repeat
MHLRPRLHYGSKSFARTSVKHCSNHGGRRRNAERPKPDSELRKSAADRKSSKRKPDSELREERRREEAETKRRLDEAEAEKRRQDKERRKLEKEAAWAAKKAQGLHRWRGAVAGGAAVVALLLAVWIGLTKFSVWMPWAVQPPTSGLGEGIGALPTRLHSLLKGHSQTVMSAVFSGDGKRVVTASEDKTARIWDVY